MAMRGKEEANDVQSNEVAKTKTEMLENQVWKLTEALNLMAERIQRIDTVVRDIRQLVGPFGLTFPDGTVLVQSLYGTKYFVDANDMVMAPQLIIYRQWEQDLSRFFLSAVTPDTVFVDVGANIGYFTCLLGSYIGASGGGRVIAIEPNPKAYELLQRNLSINWSIAPVETHHCAAGKDEALVQLTVPRFGAANATLATEVSGLDSDRITVRLNRIDSLVPPPQLVDLMKIDVEGFEAIALDGARNVIRRSPTIKIVIEWSRAQMQAAKISARYLVDLCIDLGLEFHKIPPAYDNAPDFDWSPFRLTTEAVMNMTYDNLLLVPCQGRKPYAI